jgi:hypothetical protein
MVWSCTGKTTENGSLRTSWPNYTKAGEKTQTDGPGLAHHETTRIGKKKERKPSKFNSVFWAMDVGGRSFKTQGMRSHKL